MGACVAKVSIKSAFRKNVHTESTKLLSNKFTEFEQELLAHLFKDLSLRNSSLIHLEKSSLLTFMRFPGIIGERVFKLLDKDLEGFIDFDAFQIILEKICRSESKNAIKFFFSICDFSKTRQITSENLSIILLNICPQLYKFCTRIDQHRSMIIPRNLHQDWSSSFTETFSQVFLQDPYELEPLQISDMIIQKYSINKNFLDFEAFSEFLLDFTLLTKMFVSGFREDIWGTSYSISLKIPDNLSRSVNFPDEEDIGYMRNALVLYDHTMNYHFIVIKRNLLVVYDDLTKRTIYSVVYLEGCYMKENQQQGFYLIKIFHCTQYDPRIILGFKTNEKREICYHALCKAGNIRKFKDYYTLEHRIGLGKFSEVRAAFNQDSERFAVKIIRKRKQGSIDREMMKNEIAILSIADHPNIVRLVEVFDSQKYLRLVLEYIDGFELTQKIKFGDMSEESMASVVWQIIDVILYLNSFGVLHRDIKPENIMLALSLDGPVVKLVDFGLATFTNPYKNLRSVCGTIGYLAPEMLINLGYGTQIDMWSLGIVVYSLITGKLPFYNSDEDVVKEQTLNFQIDYSEDIWSKFSTNLKDFVQCLLERDPRHRLTPALAKQHIWFIEDFPQ